MALGVLSIFWNAGALLLSLFGIHVPIVDIQLP